MAHEFLFKIIALIQRKIFGIFFYKLFAYPTQFKKFIENFLLANDCLDMDGDDEIFNYVLVIVLLGPFAEYNIY